METPTLVRFWHLFHVLVQEIWRITEPQIEEAAVRGNIPIELYYYSELGLNSFSVVEFQQRDPFTNPEKFERVFTQFDIKGWIIPTRESGKYQVSEKARQAVAISADAQAPVGESNLQRLKKIQLCGQSLQIQGG